MLPTQSPLPGISHREAHIQIKHTRNSMHHIAVVWRYLRMLFVIVFTPLNSLILTLALLLWWFGAWRDAAMTAGVVTANAVVSVVQAIRAMYTLQRITLRNAPQAMVWREGDIHALHPNNVVVGDVLLLRPGDQVVADGVILAAANLHIDESMYTGEHDARMYMESDAVRAGSSCVSGSAWYTVTNRVDAMQQLTSIAQRIRRLDTPLSRNIQTTVQGILLVATVMIVIVLIRDAVLLIPWLARIQHATVMAGLIPNALIMALTLSYALAAVAMGRAHVLVQQLPAVEAVASIDTICIDKTGTLTTNSLELQAIHPCRDDAASTTRAVARFVRIDVAGNRTNYALMHALAHIDAQVETVVQHVPFDSLRKWSMQVTDSHTWVLGAPDIIAPYLTEQPLQQTLNQALSMGARVLLLARGPARHIDLDVPTLAHGLSPYALIVMQESLRADAATTIATMQRAGVTVYILSGDEPHAVQAMARRVGITADVALHARDFFQADLSTQQSLLRHTAVIGRLTPLEKAEITALLQQHGRRVAMVGDGYNDIPALKTADVAVVLQSARAAVRSIADVVLLDDQLDGLLQLRDYGSRINQRMLVVLHHFVIRVVLSLICLVIGLVLGDVLWDPIDSSLLALFGVVIPSVMLILWPNMSYVSWLSHRPTTHRFIWWQLCVIVALSSVTASWMPHILSTVLWWWCLLSLWGRLGYGVWVSRIRTKNEPVTHQI